MVFYEIDDFSWKPSCAPIENRDLRQIIPAHSEVMMLTGERWTEFVRFLRKTDEHHAGQQDRSFFQIPELAFQSIPRVEDHGSL
jgi:hypothetical protein